MRVEIHVKDHVKGNASSMISDLISDHECSTLVLFISILFKVEIFLDV